MKDVHNQLISFINGNQIPIASAVLIGLDQMLYGVCKTVLQIMNAKFFMIENVYDKNTYDMFNLNYIDTIFILKKDIRIANDLLWMYPSIKQYVCIDSDSLTDSEIENSELMNKRLWDYIAVKAPDEIEGGAWYSSYTREKFSQQEMDEYVQNVYIKMLPYLSKSKSVLEIGCGSGLTMYSLSPLVGTYIAIDMSKKMIEKNNEKLNTQKTHDIQLYCLYAHEIEKIDHNFFDICIINSVIQCFNGHFYLKSVISMIINKMSDCGIIFAGDIMDLEKKHELHTSLHEYKTMNPSANTKLDFSNELFLAKDFFYDLMVDFSEISDIQISDKIYHIENELTSYRYDVIISLNKKTHNMPIKPRNKNIYFLDLKGYADVAQVCVVEGHSELVGKETR